MIGDATEEGPVHEIGGSAATSDADTARQKISSDTSAA